jgi:hypothetical protein
LRIYIHLLLYSFTKQVALKLAAVTKKNFCGLFGSFPLATYDAGDAGSLRHAMFDLFV